MHPPSCFDSLFTLGVFLFQNRTYFLINQYIMNSVNHPEHEHTSKTNVSLGFTRYFFNTLLALSVVSFIGFVLSGFGYQWGVWGLSFAMGMLRITAYMLIILGIVALLSLFFAARSRARTRNFSFAILSLILCGIATGTALYFNHQANTNPPIHDITTDTDNPPSFDAIAPLRADAPNPPEYAGEETAALQAREFAELITIYLPYPKDRVYDEVVSLIGSRGWDLVAGDHERGKIEATDKLPWFGFKDDVVIRLRSDNGRTIFDMRSKSRIGGSDLGVNARRISNFTEDLRARLRN